MTATTARLASARRPRARIVVRFVQFVLLATAGCGDGGGPAGPGQQPQPAGGFTLAVSGGPASVTAGAAATFTVTVTRSGGFTGAVALSAAGMPAGVTAAFNPATVAAGQTSSTLTLTTAASAGAGGATITVRGTAAGVTDQTSSIQLTIAAAVQQGPFTMSLSVASYLATPPTVLPAMPVLTITRDAGFTGPVTLSVSGAPTGLVAGVTPSNVTGTTSSLVIAASGAPNGTYSVTIRGVAAGLGERSITIPVTIAPPTTGMSRWRICSGFPAPFVAVRDGSGPWTRIVPDPSDGLSFSFNLTQPTASLAIVSSEAGGYRMTYYHYSAQELTARGANECAFHPGATTRTVTGTVTNVPSGYGSQVGMGWWFGSTVGSASGGNASYNLINLPAGPLDLIGFRVNVNTGQFVTDRGIIRRGIDPPPGGANAVLDFTGAESFALMPATWTFGNSGGQPFSVSQSYFTPGGSIGTLHVVPQVDNPASVRTVYSVPAASSQPGELHQVIATVATSLIAPPDRASRQIIAYARTLQDRTIDFGPPMPAPTVTVVPGAPAGRIRVQGTLPAEYDAGVAVDFLQTATVRFATISATRAFLGAGSAYDLEIPDLSGVLGWDTSFALRTGSPVTWVASGGGRPFDFFDTRNLLGTTRVRWAGAQTAVTAPTDGAVYRTGRVSGSITP
jgi:hypothetical protein